MFPHYTQGLGMLFNVSIAKGRQRLKMLSGHLSGLGYIYIESFLLILLLQLVYFWMNDTGFILLELTPHWICS
jgi:hypothetical protein